MKKTQFKVEDVFGDIMHKDSISPEQIFKLNKFSAKMMYLLLLVQKEIYLNLKRKK